MLTVTYAIDYLDTNPTTMSFDNLNEAHDWIHEEVAQRVQWAVDHSPYTLSEADIQDIEATEYTLITISMENEYVDDWSCKECGHTGISEAEEACPECDSTWADQND